MANLEKKFIYKNVVTWQGEKKGLLSSLDKQSFTVATPPEFKGHPGMWTPEDLLVAAVNSCIMTTFLYYAQKEPIELLNYESEAQGVLERVDNRLQFSEIKIRPKISVKKREQIEKVKAIVTKAERNCLISHSIRAQVTVLADIMAPDDQDKN